MSLVPEPADYQPALAEVVSAGAIATFDQVDDMDTALELLARVAALEEYVAKRDPERLGLMRRAARYGECRIGELLGPSTMGRPWDQDLSVTQVTLNTRWRVEFRRLATHKDAWYPEQAALSRAKLLAWLDRLARQSDDRAARTIIPGNTGETRHGDGWTIHNADAGDALAAIPDASVDLVITDPPYPRESLDLWSLLAKESARVLTPQGILVALTGQIMLPEVLARLGEHLSYGWTYCQPLPGSSSRIMARHVGQAWKPWVAYSNGAWPSGRIDWHPDVLDGAPMAKTHYQWQQSTGPAAQLIWSLSFPQAVVLDPFTGSGSYGIAALDTGRRFVGVEADQSRFATACQRLSSHTPKETEPTHD